MGLSVLVLLGAGAAATLLKNDEHRAPLPSEDELRTNGFAVWPEDTVDEGMDVCKQAEAWRLDPKETAFRFAREVLKYPEPHLNTDPIDPTSSKVRYLVGSDGVRGVFLGSVLDVRKYDRCWFIVTASPREGGWPATVSYVYRSGQPHLAIKSTGETQIGYGPWEHTVSGREQVMLDLPELEADTTGHVISLSCRKVCDASAWTLGFVPEPATTEVAHLALDELASTRDICRDGGFNSRLRALVELYAMSVEKPIDIHLGKPKIGSTVIKSEQQLRRLGIEPLGGEQWLFTVDGADLQARVIRLRDNCWKLISIDDSDNDVLRSVHLGNDSFTFHLRWGEATSATVALSNWRGGDSWELERLNGPITITGLGVFSRSLDEPFNLSISLHDGRKLVSHESSWYRTR